MPVWTDADLRAAVEETARAELHWKGPLPEGDLSAHLDSVQRLTLVVALEDRFQICFDPEDEQGVRTLDDVIALVRARVSEAADG